MKRTETKTLIKALRVLAHESKESDEVAGSTATLLGAPMCARLREAADRLQSMSEHIGLGRTLIMDGMANDCRNEGEWDDLAQEWLNDANVLTEAHDAPTDGEGGAG